jgi:hypothetical protein
MNIRFATWNEVVGRLARRMIQTATPQLTQHAHTQLEPSGPAT